jgi:hypothetical protein
MNEYFPFRQNIGMHNAAPPPLEPELSFFKSYLHASTIMRGIAVSTQPTATSGFESL